MPETLSSLSAASPELPFGSPKNIPIILANARGKVEEEFAKPPDNVWPACFLTVLSDLDHRFQFMNGNMDRITFTRIRSALDALQIDVKRMMADYHEKVTAGTNAPKDLVPSQAEKDNFFGQLEKIGKDILESIPKKSE